MSALHITRGLPGSGKSTFARNWVAEQPEQRARVNRDDLRSMLFNRAADLTIRQETQVSHAERATVRALLRRGVDVIVDSTNLRDRYVKGWMDTADHLGVDLHVHDFADSVDDCIRNDQQRENPVGEGVIRAMARFLEHGKPRDLDKINCERGGAKTSRTVVAPAPYVPNTYLPEAVLVDIDGTLALRGERSPFDWDRVGEDDLNHDVALLVHAIAELDVQVIYVSGRDEVCRDDTYAWLAYNELPDGRLFMRKAGDTRNDAIVKAEIFDMSLRNAYWVRAVIDDRDRVVKMWRGMGLTVAQVAEGDF